MKNILGGENVLIPQQKRGIVGENNNKNLVNKYLNEIGKYPILTREKEVELFEKAKYSDDEEVHEKARDILICCNLRLVVSIAKKYTNRCAQSFSFLDLVQEGNFALFNAVRYFDLKQDNKFSSYATKCIHRGINNALVEEGRDIRISEGLNIRISEYRKVKNGLYHTLFREPTKKELIGEMIKYDIKKWYKKNNVNKEPTSEELENIKPIKKHGAYEKEFDIVERWSQHIISLDVPVGHNDENSTLLDRLPDKNISTDQGAVEYISKENVEKVLERLSKNEQEVLIRHYGLRGGVEETLAAIGRQKGLSREYIRQIKDAALKKSKNTLSL